MRTYYPFEHWAMPLALPVSQAVATDALVLTCGQVDLDPRGRPLNPGDLPAQIRATCAHLRNALSRAGAGALTQVHVFYRDDLGLGPDRVEALARETLVAEPDATCTLVPLPCFYYPGVAVEIDAIAAAGPDGTPGIVCHGAFPAHRAARFEDECDAAARELAGALSGAALAPDDVAKLLVYYCDEVEPAALAAGFERLARTFTAPAPTLAAVPLPRLAPGGPRLALSAFTTTGQTRAGIREHHPRGQGGPPPLDEPWSAHVRHGPYVFLGTEIPATPGAPVAVQTREVMDRLGRSLAVHGLGHQALLKTNTYYPGTETAGDLHENLSVRATYFEAPSCPSTGVNLPRLHVPGMEIAVDALALRDA